MLSDIPPLPKAFLQWAKFSSLAMLLALTGLCWTPPTLQAQGVSVSPRKVLLDGRKRSAEVTLMNPGSKSTTYRVYLINKRMGEDGSFKTIKDPRPGELFADKMIRYSPRRVTIPGKGFQSVRILVRKPRNLPPGEYRSRIVFHSLPPASTGVDLNAQKLKPGELSVSIIPTYAVTIPIIIRHGELSVTARLDKAEFHPKEKRDGRPYVILRVVREGNRSIHGDLGIHYRPEQGEEVQVAMIPNFTVYSPYEARRFRLELVAPEGVRFAGGQLRIDYRAIQVDGGRLIFEKTLAVP